jgi:tRNA(Ile2) C34 agmatinyltransferase TiaS
MGSREVYLEDENKCDKCGKSPAYDFYGDYICPECLDKLQSTDEDFDINDDYIDEK